MQIGCRCDPGLAFGLRRGGVNGCGGSGLLLGNRGILRRGIGRGDLGPASCGLLLIACGIEVGLSTDQLIPKCPLAHRIGIDKRRRSGIAKAGTGNSGLLGSKRLVDLPSIGNLLYLPGQLGKVGVL